MTQPVVRFSIILIAAWSQCFAGGLDDLFAPGRWQQYVATAESALHEATAEAKAWHAASRLAIAAKLGEDAREPAAIADANFADAPTAKAVFLGVTELLDEDTRNVAALAKALHESRASLSQIGQWLSENGFSLGAAAMRLIPAFYLTSPCRPRTMPCGTR